MDNDPRVPIPGSERDPIPGAEPAGPVDPQTRIEVTVVLRRRAPLAGGRLTRAELAERYGADPADVELVSAAVTDAGAQVVAVDAASRRIRVAGTVATLTALFGTELTGVKLPGGGPARQRTGGLSLPALPAEAVVAVLGLDDRPQARTHFLPAVAPGASFTPVQLARAYAMPDADGTGTTVAIIELGGGFVPADLDTYFGRLGVGSPAVRAIGVDGGRNAPGGGLNSADGEVMLDVEVVGGIAPGADIAVYFAPNTDDGFLDAVSEAAHADPTPVAISISWGQSEDEWTAQARAAMDEAFADAAALGVTVTAAAGDDGSTDNSTDGRSHVDFPAASPNVLGCGGTSLAASGTETVWGGAGQGATGGGVSRTVTLPAYQRTAGVPVQIDTGRPGRGVPDVAAVADPATGYQVRVDGQDTVIGGTSAVAPLWAGLVARLVQLLGSPLGRPHEALYAAARPGQAAPGFRDITAGSNGAYRAGPGWDACTGLGTPDGGALLTVLRAG